MVKACRRCEKDLPLDMFFRRADSADGRQYVCKQCSVQILSDWAKNNPEKLRVRWSVQAAKDKASGNPRQRKWREAHRDKNNAYAKEYNRTHKAERAAYKRMYTAKNADRIRASKAIYRKNNRTKVLAWLMRRRVKKANAPGFATAEQIQARVEYYGSKCYLCRIAPYEHIDHVIPIARGGSNWPANLRPACAVCNQKKHDKLLSEVY